MKISIEIDCTPEEARNFLGMPDVSAANEVFARSLNEKMTSAMENFDVETLIKGWMPGDVPGMEQFQKMFWDQFGASSAGGKTKE